MNEMQRRTTYRGWIIRYNEDGTYTATCGAASYTADSESEA